MNQLPAVFLAALIVCTYWALIENVVQYRVWWRVLEPSSQLTTQGKRSGFHGFVLSAMLVFLICDLPVIALAMYLAKIPVLLYVALLVVLGGRLLKEYSLHNDWQPGRQAGTIAHMISFALLGPFPLIAVLFRYFSKTLFV